MLHYTHDLYPAGMPRKHTQRHTQSYVHFEGALLDILLFCLTTFSLYTYMWAWVIVSPRGLFRGEACISYIKARLTKKFLLLNTSKTKVIVLGPLKLLDQIFNTEICLHNSIFASSYTVRNLGVIFDQDMTFNSHIQNRAKVTFFI